MSTVSAISADNNALPSVPEEAQRHAEYLQNLPNFESVEPITRAILDNWAQGFITLEHRGISVDVLNEVLSNGYTVNAVLSSYYGTSHKTLINVAIMTVIWDSVKYRASRFSHQPSITEAMILTLCLSSWCSGNACV